MAGPASKEPLACLPAPGPPALVPRPCPGWHPVGGLVGLWVGAGPSALRLALLLSLPLPSLVLLRRFSRCSLMHLSLLPVHLNPLVLQGSGQILFFPQDAVSDSL